MPLKTPSWWQQKTAISTLLYPIALLYAAVLKKRRAAPVTFPATTICIGNAVAGGAGKTPLALAIGKWAKAKHIPACFVTRGYGGTLKGPLRVDIAMHSSAQIGDEPLLLAKLLPTFVAKNRQAGIRQAIHSGFQWIILDDGLQDMSIAKNLSLLVVDGTYGFGNGLLLPAGPLREPSEVSLARADAVVIIGDDFTPNTDKPKWHARLIPESKVAQALQGKRVIGFAGLGRPEKFRKTLEDLGCAVVDFHAFADHHTYRLHTLQSLHAHALRENALLVTTEKDAARLTDAWRSKIHIVPVQLEFDNPHALDHVLTPLCA